MIMVGFFHVSYHILRTRAMNDSENRYEFSVNFRKQEASAVKWKNSGCEIRGYLL